MLLALGYLALLLLGLTAQFFQHSSNDAGARATAEQLAASQRADCERFRAEIERNPSPGASPEDFPPCEQIGSENFFSDPRYNVAAALPGGVAATAGTFAVLAFVIGASAVGAEWSAKTLPGLLAWEPRRLRVLLAKLAALALVVTLAATLMQVLTIGAGALTGSQRGTFADVPAVPGGFWPALLLQSGRGVVLALIGAVLGFAIATFTRSTGAVLGLAVAYFALGEIGLRGFRERWSPWFYTTNAIAWMQRGGLELQFLKPGVNRESDMIGSSDFYQVHVTNAEAGLYLLAIAGAALALAMVLFRRRDLTSDRPVSDGLPVARAQAAPLLGILGSMTPRRSMYVGETTPAGRLVARTGHRPRISSISGRVNGQDLAVAAMTSSV